jgi:hypothetical protein
VDSNEPLPRRILDQVVRIATRARGALPAALAPRRRHVPSPMKAHIVCYEDVNDWILGKIARRLREELQALGMTVGLGKEPDPSADVNHHVIYWGYVDRKATVETVMLTHIDTRGELGKVRHQLVDVGVEMGICASFEAMHRLAHFGVPRQKLCFIHPAHDGLIKPRKTLVGLTTRIYPDGCKREHLLRELTTRISSDDFKFAIMGAGWDEIVGAMRKRGFEIDYADRFDHAAYCRLMPSLDYYLYLGMDEGSAGFLDALAAGVPTIVTPQGFHLDAPGGITHPFESIDDLERIFHDIAEEKRRRTQAVASWTWAEYGRKHALIWEYLLARKAGNPIPESLDDELSESGVVTVLP